MGKAKPPARQAAPARAKPRAARPAAPKPTVKPAAPVGAVLVVGAGIAGIQSSIDLAHSGYQVHLVEKNPSIGGGVTMLDKTFPPNHCSMCIVSPQLVE